MEKTSIVRKYAGAMVVLLIRRFWQCNVEMVQVIKETGVGGALIDAEIFDGLPDA